MPTELKNLTLNEVSIVDRGANQLSKVVLLKRLFEEETVNERRDRVANALKERFGVSGQKHLWLRDLSENYVVFNVTQEDNSERELAVTYSETGGEFTFGEPQPVEERTTYVPEAKQIGKRYYVTKNGPWEGARDKSLLKRLLGALGVDPGELEKEIGMTDSPEKRLEDLTKRVETLEAEKTALVKRAETVDAIAKAKTVDELDKIDVGEDADLKDKAEAHKLELEAETTTEKTAEFVKKLPAPLAEAFEKMTAEEQTKFMSDFQKAEDGDAVAKAMTDLVKRNADLEARFTAVEKDSEITKIQKDLGDHPKAAELAETIYRLRKVDPDAATAMVEELKALSGQVKEAGLFKQFGSDGDGGDAEDKLDKLAKARAEKDGTSFAKAYAKVLEENPDLYTETLDEEVK